MAIFKDGNVYRTYEEQVEHLTEEHEKQKNINKNVSSSLQDLIVASNDGGYNLVRFAFQKQGTFFRLVYNTLVVENFGDVGDYVEITNNNSRDIPAYGYFTSNSDIDIHYLGDFSEAYTKIAVKNVTKGTSRLVEIPLVVFEGSSLLDYNPNDCKKQLFNVIEDLSYNTSTQYVSFDLNSDGLYNYVFVGVNSAGKNGSCVFSANGEDIEDVVNQMKKDDTLIVLSDGVAIPNITEVNKGDVFTFISRTEFIKKGNIRGSQGEKGERGERGVQGIQGVQGVQGPEGPAGPRGEKGERGDQGLFIFSGILNSPNELPYFGDAAYGDAYRVINTNGSVVTYDLYFKAEGGEYWDIQPNWGGVPGEKGERGERGPQGVQGVQGEQGPKGDPGTPGNEVVIVGEITGSTSNYTAHTISEIANKNSYNFRDISIEIYSYKDSSAPANTIKFGNVGSTNIECSYMKILYHKASATSNYGGSCTVLCVSGANVKGYADGTSGGAIYFSTKGNVKYRAVIYN